LQRRQIDREIGGIEHHPHEEMTGLDVIELLGVEDVLPVMGKERRYRRNDAGTIRAGQGQNELMIGHGRTWSLHGTRTERDRRALLYHRQSPCANPGRSAMMNKQQATGVRADHG
jgi:hypothetical protein